jgi:hypothetical protein
MGWLHNKEKQLRNLFFTLTFLVLFATIGLAQDKIKVSVGYVGNEFKFDPNEVAEYLNGLWLDVDGKIVSKNGFRLGGVFNFQRTFDVTMIDPEAYPIDPLPPVATAVGFNVVKRDTDTYSFGPRLSYKAGPVEPFVTALFGFRNPTDVATRHFVRRYQAGVDLALGHFFVRPFFLEYEFVQGFAGPSTHKYGAGAGFRF